MNTLPSTSGLLWKQVVQSPSGGKMCFQLLGRLESRDANLIMPGAFMPPGKRFHLMPDIDYWVLRNASKSLAEFQSSWPQVPAKPWRQCAVEGKGRRDQGPMLLRPLM